MTQKNSSKSRTGRPLTSPQSEEVCESTKKKQSSVGTADTQPRTKNRSGNRRARAAATRIWSMHSQCQEKHEEYPSVHSSSSNTVTITTSRVSRATRISDSRPALASNTRGNCNGISASHTAIRDCCCCRAIAASVILLLLLFFSAVTSTVALLLLRLLSLCCC